MISRSPRAHAFLKIRNQKQVVMTERGMQLALDAREALREIEEELAEQLGTEAMACLRRALELGWGSQ